MGHAETPMGLKGQKPELWIPGLMADPFSLITVS